MSQNDPWAQYATPIENTAPDPWAQYATPVASAQPKQKQWSDMTPQERTQLVAQRAPLTQSQFNAAQPQPADYAKGFLSGAKDALTSGIVSPQALSRVGSPTAMLMGGSANPSPGNPVVQTESEMTSPASMATQAALGAAPKAIAAALPSAKRAGQVLGWLKNVHGDIPIDTATAAEPAAKAVDTLVRVYGGGSMPQPVARFLQAVKKGPLTFEQGREFASTVGDWLATRSNPLFGKGLEANMKRVVTDFSTALASANRNALPEDVRPLFDAAMQEYSQAKSVQKMAQVAKKYGRMAALGAAARAGWGTAGKAASEIAGP